MALQDPTKIQRVPVRICVNPNTTSGTFPYGGTELGLVQDVVLKPNRAGIPLTEEAYGNEVIDVLDLGEAWVVACAFRSLDKDVVKTLFPAWSAGTASAKPGVDYPAGANGGATAFRAGTLRSASAVKLLVAPLDPGTYECAYFPNALPMVDASAELTRQLNREGLVGAVFYATRDASGRVALLKRLEDLTL